MGMDKHIDRKASNYNMRATLLSAPGRDIAITMAIKYKLRQSEVIPEELKLREAINEWFMDSKLLVPHHFIVNMNTPYYNHDRKKSMVFRVSISVTSRKIIEGGHDAFRDEFSKEVDRLISELGFSAD